MNTGEMDTVEILEGMHNLIVKGQLACLRDPEGQDYYINAELADAQLKKHPTWKRLTIEDHLGKLGN